MQGLHGQFKEGARAFQDYFGQVLEEKWYESPWLKGEWISPDRQPVRTNAARIDCILLTKTFPKLVSPFGNAVACLEEWMPFQLRTFQADEHIFQAVLTAEQRASKERARVFSAMGREYLSKNPAEQKMLANCMALSVEQTSYCTRYCDLTSEHYNKYYCLEKLKSCWFASKKAEMGTVLGCFGVVNECLARAEVETMTSPVLKERATVGDKLIAASFPLLGELALALHPFPPLHGRLFVFLHKSTLMDLLPLLARHLERALTGYFETTSIDLNPAVRCLCTVNVGQSSITVLFRDEKGENLLGTVEILFSHPEATRTLMSRTEESSARNGLLLLREYFILKNVLSKPALWFATLLAVDVWHHGAQLAPNYKLSEHLSIWKLVVLSWILDEKSSDNVGTVFVRLMSTIELFSTPLTSPLYGPSSTDNCFDPFRFESSATKEKKAPTTKLSGFVNALCGKQCGKFMGFDLTDAQTELYRRAQPVIRSYLIKGLKEDVASRQAMAVEKPRPFPVALPVAVMASPPPPSTLTMTPPATPTVTSPVATPAATPVATVPSTVQPDVEPAIFPVGPEKPVMTLPGMSFSVQSPPLPPEIKVEPVESQQHPSASERTGPLLPTPITVTTCPSPTPPRDPRCRPRYQGIPASYQQQCEQALKEQDFVRALLLKQQGFLARDSVDYPAKPSSDFPALTSAAGVSLPAEQSMHAHLSTIKAAQNLTDRPHQTWQAAQVDKPQSDKNSTSISRERPSLCFSQRRAERRNKQGSFGQSSRKRRHSDDSNSNDDQRRLVIDHRLSPPNSSKSIR
ncbi:hypothetical protein RvY_09828 [Ramazzottius varieornatus]|uniref:Uncharacterized protein n=1 Tax=Ramazzottius varieornatus TaxID=947166 RepID=A0A1D1VG31_RAMVA|nr:hypothetical protein RvY_09828 [Ramazzottius varieornatus]